MQFERYFLLILLFVSYTLLHAQMPPRGITITTEENPAPPTDSSTFTKVVAEGEKYDTAIFDSTWKVPFKIYENRGEEMIHSWISMGAPRAPHLYLGAGIYHFDKGGMSDIQFGWYPIVYPNVWEFYFSADRMFFLKKKSKQVTVPICMGEDYHNHLRVHYNYQAKLRRDKFYGITTGIAYEGLWNPSHETKYLYQFVDVTGEQHDIIIREYQQVNVHVGLSKMRCKNIEYEAPYRRKARCRGSAMSRLTIGAMYFPVLKYDVQLDSGFIVDYAYRLAQENFSAYISWEGRVAFQHMKRECGLHMNLMFVAPSWNRETDYRFAFVNTWGLYFSLDRKDPQWKRRMRSNANY